MFVHFVIVAGLLVSAALAVHAQRLLHSALWLACASALVALEMYLLGAPEVAVIELSVGAGLVTVLFVFAINIAGDEAISIQPVVPRSLARLLVLVSVLLLGWLGLDRWGAWAPLVSPTNFRTVLWENRLLDVLLQVALIFAGVLGVLGLLADLHPSGEKPAEAAMDTVPENDLAQTEQLLEEKE